MQSGINRAALEAMIHYVLRAYSAEPEKLGSTRLHKILWNAEVRSVRRTGYPIAGETFIKQQFGPFAEHVDEIVDDLKATQRLHVVEPEDDYEVRQYIAKGEPDRDALSDDQWRNLDSVMHWVVDDHSAGSISERSHGDVWEATEMYQSMSVDAEAIQFVKPSAKIEDEIQQHLSAM